MTMLDFISAVKLYLETLKWEFLSHSPYSPSIASSDTTLPDRWYMATSEQKFSLYKDIKKWVNLAIADFFRRGIRMLGWEKDEKK